MKIHFLFPADYFCPQQVERDYRDEYETMHSFPAFSAHLLGYDAFVAQVDLRIAPQFDEEGLCIYRGWMLKPQQYATLYEVLKNHGVHLINTPDAYANCHMFPNAYPAIANHTPKALWFPSVNAIDWVQVNRTFRRFMLKDYVKSVKGSDFPTCFDTPVKAAEMKPVLERFARLRGDLFTGGFLFKEYADLARCGKLTNEYRAFFLDGRLLTLSRNSNQPQGWPEPPPAFVEQFRGLASRFYTVDFAELATGEWIVIETGDGQVSGVSPGQYLFKYYDEIRAILLRDNGMTG